MEKETVKLLNVLRRIARAAGYAAWTRSNAEATQFCVAQYNRVLARLSELEPSVQPLFTTLSESASPEVVRIAARAIRRSTLSSFTVSFSILFSSRYVDPSFARKSFLA